MGDVFDYLHSHSGIERELKMPKHLVLVDEKFKGLFIEDEIKPFTYNQVDYYKVPTISFVKKGGRFKNFMQ